MDKIKFGVNIQNAIVATMFRVGTDSWGNNPPKPVTSHDIGSICSGLVPFQVSGSMVTTFRSSTAVEITQVFIEGSYYPDDHTIKFLDGSNILGECKIAGNGNTFMSHTINLNPPFRGFTWSIEEKSFNAQVTRRYWFQYQPASAKITLNHLLEKPHPFSDIQIYDIYLHKAIIGERCPILTNNSDPESLCSDKQIFTLLVEFLYTNNIKESPSLEIICKLLKISKLVEFTDLINYCQQKLINRLTSENAFEVLYYCVREKLEEETEWICWFIGKHNIMIVSEDIIKISPINPTALAIAINGNSALKCLPSINYVTPIENILERLFENSTYADFLLHYGSCVFKLHSCILQKWKFFEILKHSNIHDPQVDIPHETFKKLLRFLYCGKVNTITFVDAGWIMAMKEYYLLDPDCFLISYCEEIITTQISKDNWLEAFILGCQLGDSGLKEQAQAIATAVSPNKIMECMTAVMETNKYLQEENRLLKSSNKKKLDIF